MKFGILFVILLTYKCINADDKIRRPGYCTLQGECGFNPTVENPESRAPMACERNVPAIELRNYEPMFAKIQKVCPHLVNPDGPTSVCCDDAQLTSLSTQLAASDILYMRCPSCVSNMRVLFCHSTCSPDQSIFVNVSRQTPMDGFDYDGVLEYTTYNTQEYADASFDSCKDVVFPQTNGKAIALSCNGYSAADCTAQQWLNFMGSTNNGIAPLDIVYQLVVNGSTSNPEAIQYSELPDDRIIPAEPPTTPCHLPVSVNESACSCTDCEASCPPLPPLPPEPVEFTINGMDGVAVIIIIIFCLISTAFLVYLVVKCQRNKAVIDFMLPKVERSLQEDENAQDTIKQNGGRSLVRYSQIKWYEKLGKQSNDYFTKVFQRHGKFIASYPVSTLIVSLLVIVALCGGIPMVVLTTDPIQLWSTEGSQVRQEKDYFDSHFTPFYRTEQVIITLKDEYVNGGEDYIAYNGVRYEFTDILEKEYMLEILEFQNSIRYLKAPFEAEYKGRDYVTLQDICLKPLEPDNNNCTIMSALNYWQNDPNEINKVVYYYDDLNDVNYTLDYHEHYLYCVQSPATIQDTTPMKQPCLGDFGGPVFPYVAIGGYENNEFHQAQALILTFVVNNFERDSELFDVAEAWESEFIRITQEWNPKHFTYAFFSERSIEDEIVRSSQSDIIIFIVGYSVIFLYIMIALGTYTTLKRVPVDLKVTLALSGIILILSSVFAATGLLGYFGVASSLIVIEVVPFLVLAIGADNIFILTLEYQRDERREGETREEQIGRVMGNVAPSMLLCSLTEATAFFLGCISDMPAVKQFALCSGIAILLDFILQITAFVAVLTLDSKRLESNRSDIFCCIKLPEGKKPKSRLEDFFNKYYTPILMNDVVRIIVILFFITLFCGCTFLASNMEVGLDQDLSVPKDSYVLDYFDYMAKYLQVGVPLYFVTKGGYNFSNPESGKLVCGSSGCDTYSLTQQISYASQRPEYWKIETPASSWYDDYISWLEPVGFGGQDSCCRYNISNSEDFCPSSDQTSNCVPCVTRGVGANAEEELYTSDEFMTYLPWFLTDNPGVYCNKGGHAAYGDAVDIVEVEDNKTIVEASYFMTYHSICIKSSDCTKNLEMGYKLAENITMTMRTAEDVPDDFEVFPYCLYYVYYVQYVTMVPETIKQIGLCLIPTFIFNYILLGFDLYSGLITVFTIMMIVVDTAGLCSAWEVDLNAVSLINLVAAIGLSIEFTSHVVRTFALNTKFSRKDRVIETMSTMGPAVFAGVAMTNLPGICVLAFATAQLIQVFFFRMCLVITLLGMAHGLIFLPVFLSYFGPPVNKAILYDQQQKAKEDGIHAESTYINAAYKSDANIEMAEANTDEESNSASSHSSITAL